MVAATLLWGATFVVVRDSLDRLDPATVVATRFALAAILLLVASAARRRWRGVTSEATNAALVGGLVTGPLTAGGYLFQAIGLTATSAGSSAFLTSTGTLLAAFLAWPILGQRPSGILSAGVLLAAAGSALLGLRGGLELAAGEAWTLLGALVYALQIVAVARWAPRADAALLAGVQAAVTAVLVAPLARDGVAALGALDAAGWTRLAYLAVAGSAIAPCLQILAQRRLPPGRIGLLFALEPLFGLLFALTLGGERYVGRWWLGAALILGAVLLVEGSAAQRSSASSRRAIA
jgi:drug/metabolite transporter (DMT)-like permease